MLYYYLKNHSGLLFLSVQAAKRRWKNLRDMHRQVLVRRNQTTGSHHKWKYEDQMEYLVPVMKLRAKEIKIKKYLEKNTEIYENSVETPNYDNGSDEDFSVTQYSTGAPIQVKEIKNENMEEITMYTEDDPLENIAEDPVKNLSKKESALHNFFMSMLETTSALPHRLQLRVQRQVFNAVMEAQEEMLSD